MSQEEGLVMQARVGPGSRWWRLAVTFVGALVLGLGAAACGGGDDEGADQGGAQQQETQQPAGGR